LMSAGLTFNRDAATLVGSDAWLGRFLDFQPSLVGFLRYVLVEVFSPAKVYGAPDAPYNPILWTMSVELAGSLLVFLYWYLQPGLGQPRKVLVGLVAMLACFGSYYALFFVGVLLSCWRADGTLDRLRAHRLWQWLAPPLALAAAMLNAFAYSGASHRHLNILCSVTIVSALYTSRLSLRFFRSAASRFLGDLSFPLYLIHFAIIVSITSWWIMQAGTVTPTIAVEITCGSVLLALLAAFVFRQVERRVLARSDAWLIGLLRAAPL